MNHEDVATILATGGNSMVKAAYSCGKPAMGVGAGNVPHILMPVPILNRQLMILSYQKHLINGMVCASEQALYC